MDVERQQGIMKQLNLFEQLGSVIRPVDFGEAGILGDAHKNISLQ